MNNILYGIHTVSNYFRLYPDKIKSVFITKNYRSHSLIKLIKEIKKFDIFIHYVNKFWIDNKLKNKKLSHQGILIYIKNDIKYEEKDLYFLLSKNKYHFLLILDRLTDVRNLGSCIRTACAAGINLIISSKYKSAKLNFVAKKIASGGADNVIFIRVNNLFETIKFIKEFGFKIFGITPNAKNMIYSANIDNQPLALVFGSENYGISKIILNQCDTLYNIPMLGDISSLNVSVSVGICVYEFLRQRLFNKIY